MKNVLLLFFQSFFQLGHFALCQFLGDKDLPALWAAGDLVAEFFIQIGKLGIHFF